MECAAIKTIAPHYINHTASETDIAAVEEHLCICQECRQFLGQLMDNPPAVAATPQATIAPEPKEPEIKPQRYETNEEPVTKKGNFGLLEYTTIGISIIILVFFLFLFLKK